MHTLQHLHNLTSLELLTHPFVEQNSAEIVKLLAARLSTTLDRLEEALLTYKELSVAYDEIYDDWIELREMKFKIQEALRGNR